VIKVATMGFSADYPRCEAGKDIQYLVAALHKRFPSCDGWAFVTVVVANTLVVSAFSERQFHDGSPVVIAMKAFAEGFMASMFLWER
jgi:hypothetical protein